MCNVDALIRIVIINSTSTPHGLPYASHSDFLDRTPAQQPALSDGAGTAAALLLHDMSVDSAQLLRGSKSIAIVHNGAVYRLQSTKLGKLILTK